LFNLYIFKSIFKSNIYIPIIGVFDWNNGAIIWWLLQI